MLSKGSYYLRWGQSFEFSILSGKLSGVLILSYGGTSERVKKNFM
jgi:hypothetical protein